MRRDEIVFKSLFIALLIEEAINIPSSKQVFANTMAKWCRDPLSA